MIYIQTTKVGQSEEALWWARWACCVWAWQYSGLVQRNTTIVGGGSGGGGGGGGGGNAFTGGTHGEGGSRKLH